MNEQDEIAVEPENQVLAATLHRGHVLTLELRNDGSRIERPRQAGVGNRDGLQRTPTQDGLELSSNRLHLGKLRHARRSPRARVESAGAPRPRDRRKRAPPPTR